MEKMCRNLRNGFLQRDGVKMRSGGRLHFSSFSMPADERTKPIPTLLMLKHHSLTSKHIQTGKPTQESRLQAGKGRIRDTMAF